MKLFTVQDTSHVRKEVADLPAAQKGSEVVGPGRAARQRSGGDIRKPFL